MKFHNVAPSAAWKVAFGALGALAAAAAGCSQANDAAHATRADDAASLRLYAPECGRIHLGDLGAFSEDGSLAGQSRDAVVTCILVRHPQGDLLFDAGLRDEVAAAADGIDRGPFHISVPRTLVGQLTEIGAPPAEIDYLVLSHSHWDHTGNANKFAHATWIVDAAEREWMFETAPEGATDAETISELLHAETIEIEDDYDVFGDGSVMVIRTPGHTPGHVSLLVRLPNAGAYLFTGDLYHLPETRARRLVPAFNHDADQTRASMAKFEQIAEAENARVVIQHDLGDFHSLPAIPDHLD